MSEPYIDRIIGIYAPDAPGVREALTAIVEGEIASRQPDEALLEKGGECPTCLSPVLSRNHRKAIYDAIDGDPAARESLRNSLRARAERAEADAATLREALDNTLANFENHGDGTLTLRIGLVEYQQLNRLAALTSGGQG